MLTIVSFIVVIGVIIFVHELGHFLAAKSVGIRVETFSLGYPPRLASRKVGETDYCIGWIPLGGYVKMSGMIDESLKGESSLTGAPWEFQSKNTLQKIWVVSAGVVMNLLLGVILYTGIAAIKGIPEASDQAVVGELTPGFPAEKAGLALGDRITAINGTAIETWEDLLEQIHPRADQEILVAYERAGAPRELRITPLRRTIEVEGAAREVGQIGIGPEITFRPASVGEVMFSGVVGTADVVALVGANVWKLVTLQVSVRELGGPILIAKLSGESAKRGIVSLLGFLALISINIGCFNLLPIPALDGAHAVIVLAEGLVRRQLPTRAKLAIQQAGMVLILGLVVLIVFNDAQRVFGFEWVKRIF